MTEPKHFDDLDLAKGDILISPCWADGSEREDAPLYKVVSVKRRQVQALGGLRITYTVPEAGEGTGVGALYCKHVM